MTDMVPSLLPRYTIEGGMQIGRSEYGVVNVQIFMSTFSNVLHVTFIVLGPTSKLLVGLW